MGYITFEHVSKVYQMGDSQVLAANDVNFEIEKGDLCVILGPSGAGKTTVLNLLGGMDKATSGKIIVDGKDVTAMTGKERTDYRRLDVGFVFQFYNLMPSLTALENVELARQVCPNALDPVQVLGTGGAGGADEQLPRPALRRRAAAGVHCPGAVQKSRRCSCVTSPRAPWTPRPGCRCWRLLVNICRGTPAPRW